MGKGSGVGEALVPGVWGWGGGRTGEEGRKGAPSYSGDLRLKELSCGQGQVCPGGQLSLPPGLPPPPGEGASKPGLRPRHLRESEGDAHVCQRDGEHDVNHGKHRND